MTRLAQRFVRGRSDLSTDRRGRPRLAVLSVPHVPGRDGITHTPQPLWDPGVSRHAISRQKGEREPDNSTEDELMGCTENSPEEAELAALTDVIEAYELQRWPTGKIPGGKG